MKSYGVRIWDISKRKIRDKTWYRVRWTVEGAVQPFERLFQRRALADSFRSDLVKAANDGEPFDTDVGRPVSETRARNCITWYSHARAYAEKKWPRLAANSRRSMVEALTAVTLVLVGSRRGRPSHDELRRALYLHAFNPRRWAEETPAEHAAALAWLERASLPVVDLDSPALVRQVLDSLCVTQQGKASAATTVRRKRAIFYNALGYAVEVGLLDANPITRVQWTAPDVAEAIDRRVVANPAQVATLLEAVSSFGNRADRLVGFFGCLYYAGTRPSEAANLHRRDCALPGACQSCGAECDDVTSLALGDCDHQRIEYRWGRITLSETAPRAGSHWTDDGKPNERRGLKHRARNDTRPVPIPPRLVALLHRHLVQYGTAPDGRLFPGLRGGQLPPSVYDRWWKLARTRALTPEQVSSPLARRPYDLRHAAASLWLNAGVPPTEIARRLGHSVAVLLKVYANCIDGEDGGMNDRIGAALG